jgi:hypothetical protein
MLPSTMWEWPSLQIGKLWTVWSLLCDHLLHSALVLCYEKGVSRLACCVSGVWTAGHTSAAREG